MTREDVLKKIRTKVASSNKWYTSRSTFNITEIEPWFNTQTIQQLPKEIRVPEYGTTRILIDEKGIEMNGDFYPWSKILVTGYITQNEKRGRLVVALTDGEIIEEYGPSEWRMNIDELGHLIELFKIKHAKTIKQNQNDNLNGA